MNNVPLDFALNKLCNLGIITERKNLYALSFENEEYQEILYSIKKEYQKRNLPHNIFMILLEAIEILLREKNVKQAMLFGSYAKLIYSDKSDIDIAVIMSKNVKDKRIHENNLSKKLNKLEIKYKKRMELHFFSEEDLKKADPLIAEIKRNGKTLW